MHILPRFDPETLDVNMVVVNFSGGLGENLFQYCFGRIVAKRFGYALQNSPIWGFPNSRDCVGGERIISPTVCWTGVAARDWRSGERIPDAGLRTPPGYRLTLNGWFQRTEYYENFLEEIRGNWLKFDRRVPPRPNDELAICIRLRNNAHWHLSDDSHLMTFPPPLYRRPSAEDLQDLVKSVSHSRLHIITDSPQASLFLPFSKTAEFHNHGDWEDLRLATSFKKLAFAATAFDWWAAVLSDAKETYPLPSRRDIRRQKSLHWQDSNSGFSDTDLRFPFQTTKGRN